MPRVIPNLFRSPQLSITLRTALLAWLVAIITLALFVLAIVPRQKQLFLDNLRSKAYGVTVSLSEVAAGAVVSEDYSSVVDHCMEMLRRDPDIDYIVVTRKDGFSLIHDRNAWNSQNLDATRWRPPVRAPAGGIETVPLLNRRAYAYSQPFDYSGIEWGWIHVGLKLDAYDQSITALYQRTALLGTLCLLFSFGASLLYARHLVRPIVKLRTVVHRVATGDLSVRADITRADELGELAVSINTMTEALLRRDRTLQEARETLEQRVRERTQELENQIAAREKAHRELAETQHRLLRLSREAGMAEVATGMLHNVGNVLNSVNISANLLRDQITGDHHLTLLKQCSDLLRAHQDHLPVFLTADPRGRHVLPLLCEIADDLHTSRASLGREFQALTQNIEHIKQIISVQQRYAKAGGLIQTFDPVDLYHDALSITHASATRHGVVVTPTFPETRTPLSTDRHLALQILVNLLKNAIQAVKPRPAGERQIDLHLVQNHDRTSFIITDNGVGIAPADRHKIFQHGFTTRKDGHGFGLHSGALAAQALGGSLQFSSRGIDHGATFTLILPAAPVPSGA